MSWQDILKDMDAEEEFERDALRRDIEAERYSESYQSPNFKKVEEKLRELVNITIPQDERMLQIVMSAGFKEPPVTRQQLTSATRKIYQDLKELDKIKKEAKEYADKNPKSGPYDDELINDVFKDSNSEYATDRGFEMLMGNKIEDIRLGFANTITSNMQQYKQLFEK